MTDFTQFARTWFDWTVAATWQLALLVCLIAAITWLLRDASPRLRHGLWLLVLLKALLPPTLVAFWGVGAWGVKPVVGYNLPVRSNDATAPMRVGDLQQAINDKLSLAAQNTPAAISAEGLLMSVWIAGCLILWVMVAWRYRRLAKATDAMRSIDEGPVRIELERLAAQFSVRNVPELYATAEATSPMLMGIVRPRIVLPESILARLSPHEVRMIVAHELVHWRRRDTWVGWLQVFVQGVFWFHPLVWLANARIRHERECACDETVLREGRCDRDGYGETIIRVLAAARGRSWVTANMVGIFERGSRLQTRLEEIMTFDPTKRKFGWLSRLALIGAALVLLPMAIPNVAADDARNASATKNVAAQPGGPTNDATTRPQTTWPTIVSTNPKVGATDVSPDLPVISVTFDRDMAPGFSWTGSGPSHPTGPPDSKPVWIDKRTCNLPVTLKKGTFYRVGINSTSFQNFRSADGVPAPTSAIYFATAGATPAVARRVRVPKIITLSPPNGATDVDPSVKTLSVTFDVPMDTSSYSWTGGGPEFPITPPDSKPIWSRDGKTCTLPVALAPGTHFKLGLNSFSHKNFASKWGVPLEPVRYEFQTAGTAAPGAAADESGKPPHIVKMVPENGAKDVDPTLAEIQVTFDRPMAAGFSWTGGGDHFPGAPGMKPSWSADRKTCTLPVKLKPNWQYRLGLNSLSFKNFASADGIPLEPVVLEFRTTRGKE